MCCFVEITENRVVNTLGACDPDETEYEVDDSTYLSGVVDKSTTVVPDEYVSVVVELSTGIGFVVVTFGDVEI